MPNDIAALLAGLTRTPQPQQGPLAQLAQKWRPQDEIMFKVWATQLPWYKEFTKQYGEPPDLNSKDYDYRAAYKAGVEPTRYAPDNNKYHWPSVAGNQELKAANHPTAWMEDYMRITGTDPHSPAKSLVPGQLEAIQEALKRRYTP